MDIYYSSLGFVEILTSKPIRRLKSVSNRLRFSPNSRPHFFQHILSTSTLVTEYKYDADEELWCEITFQVSLSVILLGRRTAMLFISSQIIYSLAIRSVSVSL